MGEVDWEKLRAPFEGAAVGKLPKGKGRGEESTCDICGGWHKQGMFHLDYVGHAHVTQRLNEVDPEWTLEPVYDPPLMFDFENKLVYMYARLTIGGVSKIDVGCSSTGKAEWPKDLWSDCVTRCAMRFGVALSMWQKLTPVQDQSHEVDRPARAAQSQRAASSQSPAQPPPPAPATPVDPDLVALLEVLQGDVDALDMASKEDWVAWKQGHAGWHKSMDTVLDARNFVMGLLDGKPSGPDLDSGTLLG